MFIVRKKALDGKYNCNSIKKGCRREIIRAWIITIIIIETGNKLCMTSQTDHLAARWVGIT